MAWYRAGTVSVTNGSTTVTGSGTDWVANSRVGDAFVGPDGRTYEIANVASATAISILPAYQGSTASAQAYAIIPVQGYTRDLADQAGQLINEYDAALDKPWIGADDAAEARTGLGLGGAATRDVGTGAGNVMEVGTGGLIIGPEFVGNVNLADLTSGSRAFLSASQSPSAQVAVGLALTFGARTTGASINNRALQIFCDTSLGKLSYRCVGVNGMTNEWSFKTSLNTVIDTNGFIKAASPVLRLLNDRIEANPEAELQSAQFERVGQGHYTITNTQGLADSGWRIEVPRDEITGELLRFVQCTQAQEVDGTWTITVKTYAPDYSSGALAAGEPLDLDERWIDVRLNSLPEQASEEGDIQPI